MENKVIKNKVDTYFIVKVNELFVSGDYHGIQLDAHEGSSRTYKDGPSAKEVAAQVGGKVIRVVKTEVIVSAYEEVTL